MSPIPEPQLGLRDKPKALKIMEGVCLSTCAKVQDHRPLFSHSCCCSEIKCLFWAGGPAIRFVTRKGA